MICSLLGQQQDSSKVEEEVEGKIRPRCSHLPETPGHLLCCTGAKSMNVQGPCPSRHHHTTPDQMHETCSSHVECASRDWSLGRDKAQAATSLTTALVLAGNDKNLLPPQASSERLVGRAQEDRQADKPPLPMPNVPATQQLCVNAACRHHCNRNRNRFPDRPTSNTARGILFASRSHTPTLLPSPNFSRKVA